MTVSSYQIPGDWSKFPSHAASPEEPLKALPSGGSHHHRGWERSWQPGQVLGCLLVSAGASEQEVQQEDVGNKAAVPTVSYRLPRQAGTGMCNKSQAKF